MALKRLLITGGGGFVGQNLVRYFINQKKYQVFAPTHHKLDLLDSEAVAIYLTKNRIKLVVHAASVGGSRKKDYDSGSRGVVDQNMRMFFNLARHQDKLERMIVFSSGAAYSRPNIPPQVKEDFFDRYVPQDEYGFSKYLYTQFARSSEKMTVLNLFGVFGVGEDYTYKFISNAIVKNLLELPIVIHQNVRFSYLDVADLGPVVGHFLTSSAKRGVYNVTPDKSVTLVQVAEAINKQASKPSKVIVLNKGMNREYTGSNEALKKEWSAVKFTSLTDSIKNYFEEYQRLLPKIDRKVIMADESLKLCRSIK